MNRHEVADALANACPSLRTSQEWRDFWDDFGDEPELPLYLLMSGLVRHVVRLLDSGSTEEFPALFSLIEELVDDPDAYVSELAVVGFLEDLQNTNLHLPTTRPSDFERFFGPFTAWWWEEVRLFWEEGVVPIGSSKRPRPAGMSRPVQQPGPCEPE